jgi:hypothetical protein
MTFQYQFDSTTKNDIRICKLTPRYNYDMQLEANCAL